MPKDFVKVDTGVTTAKMAAPTVQFVAAVRDVIDRAEALKGVMDHNVNGGDYADMEALFGVSAGNGTVLYNLVAGTLGALKGTVQAADALTLIDRVG